MMFSLAYVSNRVRPKKSLLSFQPPDLDAETLRAMGSTLKTHYAHHKKGFLSGKFVQTLCLDEDGYGRTEYDSIFFDCGVEPSYQYIGNRWLFQGERWGEDIRIQQEMFLVPRNETVEHKDVTKMLNSSFADPYLFTDRANDGQNGLYYCARQLGSYNAFAAPPPDEGCRSYARAFHFPDPEKKEPKDAEYWVFAFRNTAWRNAFLKDHHPALVNVARITRKSVETRMRHYNSFSPNIFISSRDKCADVERAEVALENLRSFIATTKLLYQYAPPRPTPTLLCPRGLCLYPVGL